MRPLSMRPGAVLALMVAACSSYIQPVKPSPELLDGGGMRGDSCVPAFQEMPGLVTVAPRLPPGSQQSNLTVIPVGVGYGVLWTESVLGATGGTTTLLWRTLSVSGELGPVGRWTLSRLDAVRAAGSSTGAVIVANDETILSLDASLTISGSRTGTFGSSSVVALGEGFGLVGTNALTLLPPFQDATPLPAPVPLAPATATIGASTTTTGGHFAIAYIDSAVKNQVFLAEFDGTGAPTSAVRPVLHSTENYRQVLGLAATQNTISLLIGAYSDLLGTIMVTCPMGSGTCTDPTVLAPFVTLSHLTSATRYLVYADPRTGLNVITDANGVTTTEPDGGLSSVSVPLPIVSMASQTPGAAAYVAYTTRQMALEAATGITASFLACP